MLSIVPEIATGLEKSLLLEFLLGINVSKNTLINGSSFEVKKNGFLVRKKTSGKLDSINTSLSAFMWFERLWNPKPIIFNNPFALRPIDLTLFPKFQKLFLTFSYNTIFLNEKPKK